LNVHGGSAVHSLHGHKRRKNQVSEFKPKKDDNRASKEKEKAGDSPKRQGDKLQHAVDEAAKPVEKKP
jgi:hypothetical protein